jgi:hypothetical protein
MNLKKKKIAENAGKYRNFIADKLCGKKRGEVGQ